MPAVATLSAREVLDRKMTEDELLRAVVQMAGLFGWRFYHTRDSRRSEAGFPDLVLVRVPRLIFAELKKQTGRATSEQQAWLECLRVVGQAPGCHRTQHVESYLWRPSDWSSKAIEEVLR